MTWQPLAEYKGKEAVVVWVCLQTQQYLQGVVARHSGREEKKNKKYVAGQQQKLDTGVR